MLIDEPDESIYFMIENKKICLIVTFVCLFSALGTFIPQGLVFTHITLQPKTGFPLKLSRVKLVSTWMGDLLRKLGCCWKRC